MINTDTSFSTSITDLVSQRYSCRQYQDVPLKDEHCIALSALTDQVPQGPFGSPARFHLIAATREDASALRDLGTYGVIQNPSGFVVGAAGQSPQNLEDFGYQMEWLILRATGLGLKTCWLGGYFTRSSFSSRIKAREDETIPAVFSVGYAEERAQAGPGLVDRMDWANLFFDRTFGAPLSKESAGDFALPLEMVRLAPSASNKQPWRMIKDGNAWHFYLVRTQGYREKWVTKMLVVEDLQRVDLGIAMCHFELAARELGMKGAWALSEPDIQLSDPPGEYTATWLPSIP